jgi:hypothetical protein
VAGQDDSHTSVHGSSVAGQNVSHPSAHFKVPNDYLHDETLFLAQVFPVLKTKR